MVVVVFFMLGKRHLATDFSLLYLTHSSLRYLIYDISDSRLQSMNPNWRQIIFATYLGYFVYGKNT